LPVLHPFPTRRSSDLQEVPPPRWIAVLLFVGKVHFFHTPDRARDYYEGGRGMYKEPIFLKPVYQERIWGGDKLNTIFGYDIPNDHTGEAWAISAHENGPSELLNGPLKGQHLRQVWEKHPKLFGKASTDGAFPLLVKMLDAN